MTISHHFSHDSSCYSDGCEIIVPVTLRVPICLQPEEARKWSVNYSQGKEPVSESSIPLDHRVFIYEVVGLYQNVRRSSRFCFTVPYSRMSQEMQRITRQGGQIVSVRPKF